MLRADNVSFAYLTSRGPSERPAFALRDVTLGIERGGLTGLLGPNGSGKTTMLRLLAGMVRPVAGRVQLDGRDVWRIPRGALARRLAVVPQETHLAFDYSVLEAVLMGRHPHLGPFELEGPRDVAIARDALAATGTLALEERRFATLSGGEKQRVIIAGALAQLQRHAPGDTSTGRGASSGNGEILLLDEPTASLDLGYQLEIAAILRRLNRARGLTIVISTHDLNLAASLCRHMTLLRDGRVLAAGDTATVLTPQSVRALYDVEADVRHHDAAGHLTVVPVRRVPR